MLRTSLVCVLAMAGGCVNDLTPEYVPEEPGPPPEMLRTRTMAGELPVAGIDSDRAGGLWIAYSKATGDYYVPDDVRVVHVDAHGTKLVEHRFLDEHVDLRGIAYDGHRVWMSVNSGLDTHYVRAIDAVSGLEVIRYDVEAGISDLEVDDERQELLLSSEFDRVIAMDLEDNQETWRAQLRPAIPNYYGQQSAIAMSPADHLLWVGSRFWDRFDVRNAQHQSVAGFTTDVTGDHHTTAYGLYLAWDKRTNQLIAAAENQISWLSIRGATP